jgi:hypothetical protein
VQLVPVVVGEVGEEEELAVAVGVGGRVQCPGGGVQGGAQVAGFLAGREFGGAFCQEITVALQGWCGAPGEGLEADAIARGEDRQQIADLVLQLGE